MRGHLEIVQLLCRHGASRSVQHSLSTHATGSAPEASRLDATPPNDPSDAELAAAHHGHSHINRWLRRTRGWHSPLHYIDMLSEDEVRANLLTCTAIGDTWHAFGDTPFSPPYCLWWHALLPTSSSYRPR